MFLFFFLRSSAFHGNIMKIKEYLAVNLNLSNAVDNRGNTPVIYAAIANQFDVIAELLVAGADINIRNKLGVKKTNYSYHF